MFPRSWYQIVDHEQLMACTFLQQINDPEHFKVSTYISLAVLKQLYLNYPRQNNISSCLEDVICTSLMQEQKRSYDCTQWINLCIWLEGTHTTCL